MQTLLANLSSGHPLQSAVNKLLNRLDGERDWAAQEVFHMLLHLPLQRDRSSETGPESVILHPVLLVALFLLVEDRDKALHGYL
jgi:hypothetical protein